MTFVWESVVSALSLSMDAFAVALCIGACAVGGTYRTALRMGTACGAFQFFMPLVGWLLGTYSLDYIASLDHWAAFGLLALVGGDMIRSSFAPQEVRDTAPMTTAMLLYLALATSIDALAVGASFAMVGKPALWLAAVAGLSTAALCFGGVQAGRLAGSKLGKRVEFVGGALLCLIGFNILRAHLWS
ncbi:MAG: manganese efflux pump MntP family protein [Synergistaceae bacterium]|nr:manganese efflux pump MntP family protein [Synergistaceae bacterium]